MKKNIDIIIHVKDRQDLLIRALNNINDQKLLHSNIIIFNDWS